MKTTHKFGFIVECSDVIPQDELVVQVDMVGDYVYYECVKKEHFFKALEDKSTAPEADNSADFIEACETELKSDPFKSGWHNGHKLIEIRENDPEWWARALKELKNNFIVAKMRTIEEGIANGKIYS